MSEMDNEMEDGSGIVKKFMFLNRKAPHGTVYALEGLEVVLITAAFDQDVSMYSPTMAYITMFSTATSKAVSESPP